MEVLVPSYASFTPFMLFAAQYEQPEAPANMSPEQLQEFGKQLIIEWERLDESEVLKLDEDLLKVTELMNVCQAQNEHSDEALSMKKKKESKSSSVAMFHFFKSTCLPILQEQEPGLSIADLNKMIGYQWKHLSSAERTAVEELAEAERKLNDTKKPASAKTVNKKGPKVAATKQTKKKKQTKTKSSSPTAVRKSQRKKMVGFGIDKDEAAASGQEDGEGLASSPKQNKKRVINSDSEASFDGELDF
eukprot:GILJ01007642.1.p1 GENE.GILJ01007642.1~~GILJ01007642.1.p1  ORF type:complete len:247 (-),score=63.01 GILJ01007642.1:100-840(-)